MARGQWQSLTQLEKQLAEERSKVAESKERQRVLEEKCKAAGVDVPALPATLGPSPTVAQLEERAALIAHWQRMVDELCQ